MYQRNLLRRIRTLVKTIVEWWQHSWNGYSVQVPLDPYTYMMVYKHGYDRPVEKRKPVWWARALKATWSLAVKLRIWVMLALGFIIDHFEILADILELVDKIRRF